jgi:hypothetical protein
MAALWAATSCAAIMAFKLVLWLIAVRSGKGGPDLLPAHPHRPAGTIAMGDVPAAPKYQPLDRFRDLIERGPGLESGNSSARVLFNQSCASTRGKSSWRRSFRTEQQVVQNTRMRLVPFAVRILAAANG